MAHQAPGNAPTSPCQVLATTGQVTRVLTITAGACMAWDEPDSGTCTAAYGGCGLVS